jgi:DNA-binding IscR family transcriptional regulator
VKHDQPLSDLHMLLLGWIGEHSDGACVEQAARELGVDLAVAERLFGDLVRAGYIASA